MQDYTINSGDCLWKITKNYYGDKLTSNSDIQKAIDKIVEENGIENPNLIYAGNLLKLPEFEDIFGNNGQNPLLDEGGVSLFNEFNGWQDKHAINMQTLNNVLDKGMNQEDALDEYFQKKEEIGLTFDFMQGKDFNNEQDYNAQLSKLGEGEVEIKDRNDDNKVNFNEYFIQEGTPAVDELKEKVKNGTISQQEATNTLSQLYYEANAVFNVIDTNMGNGDKNLTADEFATYYSYLDNFAGGDGKSAKDGKIEIDYVTEYPEYLLEQMTPFEDIDDNAKAAINKIAMTLLSDE